MAELFREGLFIQFRCEPSVVGSDKIVTATAVFFLSQSSSLANLKPVVKCQEWPKFVARLQEDLSRSSKQMRTFYGDLDLAQFGVRSGSITLTLHPDMVMSAVASTTVQVFEGSDFSEAQEQLRQH